MFQRRTKRALKKIWFNKRSFYSFFYEDLIQQAIRWHLNSMAWGERLFCSQGQESKSHSVVETIDYKTIDVLSATMCLLAVFELKTINNIRIWCINDLNATTRVEVWRWIFVRNAVKCGEKKILTAYLLHFFCGECGESRWTIFFSPRSQYSYKKESTHTDSNLWPPAYLHFLSPLRQLSLISVKFLVNLNQIE